MRALRGGAAVALCLAWGAVRDHATWSELAAFREEFDTRDLWSTPSAEETLRLLLGPQAPAYDAVREHVPLDARVLYLFSQVRAPWNTAVQPRRAAGFALFANGALVQAVPARWTERLASPAAFARGV